jgi:hypothetical protein
MCENIKITQYAHIRDVIINSVTEKAMKTDT